jgi:hypothetical protein
MIHRVRFISAICLLVAISCHATQAPVWPVQDVAFEGSSTYREYGQATASGKPESALFGCVRTNGRQFHEAIDIAPVKPRNRGEATDPIIAIHDGIVKHISNLSGNSSYGRYVVIEHPGLDLVVYSLYSHLASIGQDMQVGKAVHAGDVIGIMGRSAGGYTIPRERAHLHLEIGLRLSDEFENWYVRQGYSTPNKHGNFNGINLIGLDPADYFERFRIGQVRSPLEYLETIPPAVMVHVFSDRKPDFIERYPELVIPGCDPLQQAGWEVILSAWGLPLSVKALDRGSLLGVTNEGDISVVGVDRTELSSYACRRIVQEGKGKVVLGRGGQAIIEMMFMPGRRAE